MNFGHLASNRSPASEVFTDDGLPAGDFYYVSLQHREALATLRYGIEARKGMILCTGDAGVGKSVLLRKLEGELGTDITYLVITDPYLSFAEVNRRIARRFDPTTNVHDERASIDRCQQLLHANSAAGRITALAFDDAQHLRDDTLEQLRQSFLGSGGNDPQRNLAQLILTGRPELKERLFLPPLRSLGALVAVECRLQTLDEKDLVEYVRQRLRAADLPENFFEPEALTRIASYSGGNFRQANALCDRALRTAQNSVRTQIGAEIIDGAAKDLQLWQPRWVRKETLQANAAIGPRPTAAAREPRQPSRNSALVMPHEPFHFQFGDDDSTAVSRNLPLRGARGHRLFIGSLVVLALVAIPGLWLYSDVAKQAVGALGDKLEDFAGSGKSRPLPLGAIPHTDEPPMEPAIPAPSPKVTAPSESADLPQRTPSAETRFDEPPMAPEKPVPTKPPVETKKVIPPPPRVKSPPETANLSHDDLTTEVFKAIQNRAIEGVRISVSDDVVFLDGRVATERQRRAAESAARSVPGVRGVRNRIALD